MFTRLAELSAKPITGRFDFSHLLAIHNRLFSDIYPMAGKVRTVDMAKQGSVFCYVQNIDYMQREIFSDLERKNHLRGLEKRQFIEALAKLSGDLNALHPFREGNGRAIRTFLSQLAAHAGYTLSFDKVQSTELLQADIAAFSGNTAPLTALYERIVEPID